MLCLFSLATYVPLIYAATVWTDEPEYLKGDISHIYGESFAPYTSILIKVTRPDGSVVTGDGSETIGSDTILTNVDGNFAYSYSINGIQAEGIYTVEAIDTAPDPDVILATTTFLDKAQFLLQGCSWTKGDCTQAPLPAWANGPTPMDGWTSGVLKGWAELDYVSYRLRVNLPKPGDAGTYYITNEHDNLRSGVTGVDDMTEFYVGKMVDGTLTKTCTFQATRTTIDNPTSLNPCIVTGHTYTGQNDDPLNDLNIDEETTDGLDDDFDGLVDEDPYGSSVPARRIQDTWAVLFDSSEAGGSNKKWALYWKAHLALGSGSFPGASLHANTTATGSQDVPIKNIQPSPPPPADLYIQKDYSGIVNPGKTLSFTLEYGNTGGSDAFSVVITDDYDEDYLNPIPGSICCGGIDDGDKITWSAGTVTAGSGPFVLTYNGKIHDNTPDTNAHMPVGDTHVVNTATITTSSMDSDLTDNIWAVDILVHAEPNLFVIKTVNSTSQAEVKVGDTVTIDLTYGNSDNNDAPDVTLCDDYNQAFLAPIISTITTGGVDDGDKICWGLTPDTLPGVISGTRTLPGIDPVVSYQANVIDDPVDWSDTATITTSDPEPLFKLINNASTVQFELPTPTSVRLSSFNASYTGKEILISWNTGSEKGTEGFNILRSISLNGPYTRINILMIKSGESFITGGRYSFLDLNVEEGYTYYYKIEEVDNRGGRTGYGPVVVVAENSMKEESSLTEGSSREGYPIQNIPDGGGPMEETPASPTPLYQGSGGKGENLYTIVSFAESHTGPLPDDMMDSGIVEKINRVKQFDGIDKDSEELHNKEFNRDVHTSNLMDEAIFKNEEIDQNLQINNASPESIRFRIIDIGGNEMAVAGPGVTNKFHVNKGEIKKQKDGNNIVIRWYATRYVKGFHVLRSTERDGLYKKITTTPIPYIGTGASGEVFHYTYTDTKVEDGREYYYKIESIYNDMSKTVTR